MNPAAPMPQPAEKVMTAAPIFFTHVAFQLVLSSDVDGKISQLMGA